MAERPLVVCVFCASSTRIGEEHQALAAAVGTEIGRRGWTLVSGGGSVSSMGAVARATRAAGGRTVGVIPRALVALEVADHQADELVVTDDMRQRKGVMDQRSDAFLALPGGLGTLEELLEVWVAGALGLHSKPVVVLDPEGVYEDLRGVVDTLAAAGFVRAEAAGLVRWTQTVEQAFSSLAQGVHQPRPAPALEEEALEGDP